jgi:hypothetical protein
VRENGTGAGVPRSSQAARVTLGAFGAARPVTIVWSAPHQQVKATTIPRSVFVRDDTWLGKISWRWAQAVQWWSNMRRPPSETADGSATMVHSAQS